MESSYYIIGGGFSPPRGGYYDSPERCDWEKTRKRTVVTDNSKRYGRSKGANCLSGGIDLSFDKGNAFTSGASKQSHEDVSHQAISSYFIGPQAENLSFFKDNIDAILEEVRKARMNYYPSDGVCACALIPWSEFRLTWTA